MRRRRLTKIGKRLDFWRVRPRGIQLATEEFVNLSIQIFGNEIR